MNRTLLALSFLVLLALVAAFIPGCDELTTEIIEVDRLNVRADFRAQNLCDTCGCCAPCTVLFEDISSGGVVSRIWNFGDGAETTLVESVYAESIGTIYDTISHVFDSTGFYDIELVIIDTMGTQESEVKLRYVVVLKANAAFGVQKEDTLLYISDDSSLTVPVGDTGCLPYDVQFRILDGLGVSQVHWDFGNGDTSGSLNPRYTYSDPGVYEVALNVQIDSCDTTTDSDTGYVIVYDCPEALFEADAVEGCPPFTVTFTDMSVGEYDSLFWDFDDDATAVGDTSQATYQHTYEEIGTYTVELAVSGDLPGRWGVDTSATLEITVLDTVAAAMTRDTTAFCELTEADSTAADSIRWVHFFSQSDGPVDSLRWEFDDGSSYEGDTIAVPFDSALATFSVDVRLIAFGQCNTDTLQQPYTFSLELRPDATISADPVTVNGDEFQVVLGEEITFTAQDADTYEWAFIDDNTSSTDQVTTHTYTEEGTFLVTLRVTNECGIRTSQKFIEVLPSGK